MNIEVHESFQISFFLSFFWYIPRGEIAGSHDSFILSFLDTAILFSTVAAPIYISMNSVWGSPFLHIFANFLICVLFEDNHSCDCGYISVCF